MTRLVMTLLVRDEAEMVAANLDHHLARGVDFVVATDNGSVDGTREILAEYARKGVLHLLDEPTQNFMQDVWGTRMAHLAFDRFGADWILPNDADEFWCARRGDLKFVVRETRADVLRVPRVDLLPTQEQIIDPAYAFHWNVLRPSSPKHQAVTANKGKVLFRASKLVTLDPGNHEVTITDGARADAENVSIFHFPYRTYAAFERKVRNGGAALRANADWPDNWGYHWRKWHVALEEGRLRQVFDTLVPTEQQAVVARAEGTLVFDDSFAQGHK